MLKPQSTPYMTGSNLPPGDAPPQYAQGAGQLGQNQSGTQYGQPPNPDVQQQGYVYGQYASNAPQSQPAGVTTPQPNWPPQNQSGQYPPHQSTYTPPLSTVLFFKKRSSLICVMSDQ